MHISAKHRSFIDWMRKQAASVLSPH